MMVFLAFFRPRLQLKIADNCSKKLGPHITKVLGQPHDLNNGDQLWCDLSQTDDSCKKESDQINSNVLAMEKLFVCVGLPRLDRCNQWPEGCLESWHDWRYILDLSVKEKLNTFAGNLKRSLVPCLINFLDSSVPDSLPSLVTGCNLKIPRDQIRVEQHQRLSAGIGSS